MFKIIALLPVAYFVATSLFFHWHILRPQSSPADQTNRINKIRLVWFALTREELFTDTFPWLKNDELENMKDEH